MNTRLGLWIGAALDLLLLLPAFYMAISAVNLAIAQRSAVSAGIAALFSALPVFCLAGPFAAWRARSRRRPTLDIVFLFAAPWVYAIFLVIFLLSV